MSRVPPTHLVYLHGFRSSPRSFKAVRLQQWLAAHRPGVTWWCPQLPPSPAQAMTLLQAQFERWPSERLALVGSSLGGFYATHLCHRFGCRTVLLNPAVDPARDLAAHVGEQSGFHAPHERFRFEAQHLDELRALKVGALRRPEQCLAIIATGDELLDWREMADYYAGCQLHVIQGSDHSLSDFDQHLPTLLDHLDLST